MSDNIAEFIRREREALLKAAPSPHAARVWHEARRRRAASLRRSMSSVAWLVSLVIAAATAMSFAATRGEAHFLLLLLVMLIWLTRGVCAPVRLSKKGTSE